MEYQNDSNNIDICKNSIEINCEIPSIQKEETYKQYNGQGYNYSNKIYFYDNKQNNKQYIKSKSSENPYEIKVHDLPNPFLNDPFSQPNRQTYNNNNTQINNNKNYQYIQNKTNPPFNQYILNTDQRTQSNQGQIQPTSENKIQKEIIQINPNMIGKKRLSKIDTETRIIKDALKWNTINFINIICNKTNKERLEMIESYKKQFNRDLVADIESEFSFNFKKTVIALFQDPITYDCFSLNNAMKGITTNEDTIIEIIVTRSKSYINQIKEKYIKLFGKSLYEELSSKLSGDIKTVILTIFLGARSENKNPDKKDCEEKADQLYSAGEKIIGTNEKVFFDILTKASIEEIILIDKIYKMKYRHGLIYAIDKEFSFNMNKFLTTIVMSSINPSEYFARRVNYAVKGLGTKDTLLIRIIVTRSEIDMPQIIKEYKKVYNKDMIEDIEDDTSGDYKRILVKLCKH